MNNIICSIIERKTILCDLGPSLCFIQSIVRLSKMACGNYLTKSLKYWTIVVREQGKRMMSFLADGTPYLKSLDVSALKLASITLVDLLTMNHTKER